MYHSNHMPINPSDSQKAFLKRKKKETGMPMNVFVCQLISAEMAKEAKQKARGAKS